MHLSSCLRMPSPGRWARRTLLSAVVACAGLSVAQAQLIPPIGPPPTTVQGTVDVTTYAYDTNRTGSNPQESLLAPKAVNPFFFGQLFSVPADGQVYAQPLYLHSLVMPDGRKHNVVYVATEHDSIYAFDADTAGAPLWHVSFIDPANGVTTVSSADVNTGDINPEIGITGTPVIDPTSGTIYLVAKTKEITLGVTTFVQRLHALDVHTGAEKPNSPVVIQGAVPGTGDGNDGNGNVPFSPLLNNQRPALLLLNGTVYIAWASHGDNGPYHGWVMGYNATTLAQTSIWNTTPNAVTYGYPLAAGGIWMAGCGPAADAEGNIFVSTGNGTFDVNPMSQYSPAYGDSIVKLSTTKGLSVADYFTPFDQQNLDDTDADLGSGGVVLVPGTVQFNGHTHLLVQSGKEGKIYVVDRDQMGHNDPNSDYVAQFLGNAVGGVWGKPAYFNSTIYFGGSNDTLKAFSLNTYRSTNYYFDVYGGATDDALATNFTLNGTAAITNGAIELTDGKANEAGSAFGTLRANVAHFTTEFIFNVTGATPTDDGLSFTIQGDSPYAVGQDADGLGFVGIPSSVSIKWDQVNQSTGLYINGVAQGDINLSLAEINLASGDDFYVTITYNGTNLQVVTQDIDTGAIAIESYPINLPSIVGSQLAYVGFTGSTAANGSTQEVYAFEYSGPTTVQRLFAQSSASSIGFGYPGPSPVISSLGTANGIVWVIQSDQYGYGGPAVLHAFEASNLANELYNSASANENPVGAAVKFTVPVVANGKVYVGSSNGLTVYGQRRVSVP
jgi:hypothetical protein